MTTTGALADELSYQLSGLPTHEQFVDAASALLAVLIAGDGVAWNHLDLAAGTAVLRGTPTELTAEPVRSLLAAHAGDHPIIQSYLRDPASLSSPRRMSDVASRADLLRTGSYMEVMRPLGIEFQLSVMATRNGALTGSGWALSRSGCDFTDDDLRLAAATQPMLSLLSLLPRPRPAAPELAERLMLTERERQVLGLLAEGCTAQQIGSLLRIAPATARKHLERVYAKLDVHDRLMAVQQARALGLLAP